MSNAYRYSTPIDDINFALDVAGVGDPKYASIPNIASLQKGGELTTMLKDTVGPFVEKDLNDLYDSPGHVTYDATTQTVTLPGGYKEAYDHYAKLGIMGMPAAEKDGGGGMPKALGAVMGEVCSGGNNVFELTHALTRSVYAGLTAGARDAEPGNEAGQLPTSLRDAYLRNLMSGNSTGIMGMTEAGAGSDLQANVKVSAHQLPDSRYRINGTKIFITSGDNQYTTRDSGGNIVHLTLVRIDDDKKLSLMAIPKFPVDDNGVVKPQSALTEDERQHKVFVSRIEDKMGLEHSATTTMNYENAVGYLVGERGKGMNTMFAVMNEARRAVGRQSIGIADLAFQRSFKHAKNEDGLGRTQGRSANIAETPDNPGGDPIIVHPAVREMLLRQRSFVEGARVLDLMTELEADAPDADSKRWVQLMTNVQKYHFSEQGFKAADLAVQVFGGAGYIKETGIEKLERDARIGRIYEGTNQIQAVTFVAGQLPNLEVFEKRVDDLLGQYDDEKYTKVLKEGLIKLRAQKAEIIEALKTDKNAGNAAAESFIGLVGHMALGYVWARTAQMAQAKLEAGDFADHDKLFYETKLATANFHNNVVLNEAVNGKQVIKLSQLEIPDAGIRRQDIVSPHLSRAETGTTDAERFAGRPPSGPPKRG